jgi:hypothetical protein
MASERRLVFFLKQADTARIVPVRWVLLLVSISRIVRIQSGNAVPQQQVVQDFGKRVRESDFICSIRKPPRATIDGMSRVRNKPSKTQ